MSRQFLVPITLPDDPAQPLEAVTKQYCDANAGGAIDVLWVGPEPPTDPTIELWWDTDAESPTMTGYVARAGDTMTGDLVVPAEGFGPTWDGSLEVPTKDALFDRLGALTWFQANRVSASYPAGDIPITPLNVINNVGGFTVSTNTVTVPTDGRYLASATFGGTALANVNSCLMVTAPNGSQQATGSTVTSWRLVLTTMCNCIGGSSSFAWTFRNQHTAAQTHSFHLEILRLG